MDERQAADAVLRHLHRAWQQQAEAAIVQVEDAGPDWRVFYQSKAFVETGAVVDSLVGNLPYLVDKVSGDLRVDETYRRAALGLPAEPSEG